MKATERTPAASGATVPEDRRRRGSRRTRGAPATAALDLILERGLAATTVEAVAGRADVTRRTCGRHFASKEDAALDFVRGDGDRVNALPAARPTDEPPLLAYRRAVHDRPADPDEPAWHPRPRMRGLLVLADTEPALFAAYERVRVDAREESVRPVGERLGTNGERDLRPAVVVDAAAGVLTAAPRVRARRAGGPGPEAADLAALVEQGYDSLITEAAAAAPDSTTEE